MRESCQADQNQDIEYADENVKTDRILHMFMKGKSVRSYDIVFHMKAYHPSSSDDVYAMPVLVNTEQAESLIVPERLM